MGNCRSSTSVAGPPPLTSSSGEGPPMEQIFVTPVVVAKHNNNNNNSKRVPPLTTMSLATVATEGTVEDSATETTVPPPPLSASSSPMVPRRGHGTLPPEVTAAAVRNSTTTKKKSVTSKAHATAPTTTAPTTKAAAETRPSSYVVSATDADGNTNLGAELDRNTMEELDYEGPTSLEEEINELLEAMYAALSEEDLQAYQEHMDVVEKQQIAEGAAKAVSRAFDFSLLDQDGERVALSQLCQRGPVVLQFYRGKWCPYCNVGLMAFDRYLPEFEARGATFIAISPMLPDGSQSLATKRDLHFAILSDVGNTVARSYRITFQIPQAMRPKYQAWGSDLTVANGDDLWEVPLVATYIINQQQDIVWSFVDNNHFSWAEPTEVLQALDEHCPPSYSDQATPPSDQTPVRTLCETTQNHSKSTRVLCPLPTKKRKPKRKFGTMANAMDHLGKFLLPTN